MVKMQQIVWIFGDVWNCKIFFTTVAFLSVCEELKTCGEKMYKKITWRMST